MKQLICNRCGKMAKEDKTTGDHCGQFHDEEKKGMFCSGSIKEVDNYDGAPVEIIARELKKCASCWESKVRLIGNVRAEDVIRLCDFLIKGDVNSNEQEPNTHN